MASELFEAFDEAYTANKYKNLATKILKSRYALCWDHDKNLLADTPVKRTYSQHANIFAILTEMLNKAESHDL